jgi:hypothetical protein
MPIPDYRGKLSHMVSVFHGKGDVVVNRRNAGEIIKQWTNLHGADNKADSTVLRFQNNKRIRLYLYKGCQRRGGCAIFFYKRYGPCSGHQPRQMPLQWRQAGAVQQRYEFLFYLLCSAVFWLNKHTLHRASKRAQAL